MSNTIFIWIFALLVIQVFSQSGSQYRGHTIMDANQVKTVLGNWGVVAQPADEGPRGAWINVNNGYVGDFSLLIGARIEYDSISFVTVTDCPLNRPSTGGFDFSNSGIRQAYEPRAMDTVKLALSNDPDTWPTGWTSWPFNTTAALECYFEMDDNADNEFNDRQENIMGIAFKPDTLNLARNGLALKIETRYRQFDIGVLNDAFIMEYNIFNEGTTLYREMVFGGLVGTYVGVTGNVHTPQEYDDDTAFFDLVNNVIYFWDWNMDVSRNPEWVGDIGYTALAFIRSPGNPYDGIDNDRDNGSQPGNSAPFFTASDFEGHIIQAEEQIVLIDETFNRNIITVPEDSLTVTTCGKTVTIYPDSTYVEEGNSLTIDIDGIDNDFDGLIDENYNIHYQFEAPDMIAPFHINNSLGPTQYIDYFSGKGLNDSHIDESGDDADELGLTSFHYFVPASQIPLHDDEHVFNKMIPAYFDLPSSYSDGNIMWGEDGDVVIGSGIFPLKPGEQQKISLALIYANTPEELTTKVKSIQSDSIYVSIKNSVKASEAFNLYKNYPNPFNPSTTIEFTLPKSEFIELKVYNILGKEVSTLASKKLNQGNHTYTFDGSNLASGIYYYQLVAGDYRDVKKMILLK